MGVVLGTLTTKDGLVIPLPTAADVLEEPVEDEYRKEEEKKYSRCIRKPLTHGVWDSSWKPRPVTRPVALYMLKTQNLKHQGEMTMQTTDYTTTQFKVFDYIFKHPDEWLNSTGISKMVGIPLDHSSASLTPIRRFLREQGIIVEKESGRQKQFMFKAKCENPAEESKLWYAKMLTDKRSKNKKPPAAKASNPQPQAAAPKTSNTVTPVHVDTVTMEAIVRVPLAKLASVLKLLTS